MYDAIIAMQEMLSENASAQPREDAMVHSKSEQEIRKEFARRLEIACDSCPACPKRHHGMQKWLGDKTGTSTWAAGKWLSGESVPRPSRIKELAKVLNVDELWLSMGRGKMRPDEDDSPDAMALIDRPALEAIIMITIEAMKERSSRLPVKSASKVAAQVYIDHITHRRDYSKEAIHDLMSLLESA